MFRLITYLLFTVVLISVVRMVVGILAKAFGSWVSGASTPNQPPSAKAPSLQVGGDLHRDPVCGTFVAESTTHQRQIAGKTFYYCSAACQQKHELVPR